MRIARRERAATRRPYMCGPFERLSAETLAFLQNPAPVTAVGVPGSNEKKTPQHFFKPDENIVCLVGPATLAFLSCYYDLSSVYALLRGYHYLEVAQILEWSCQLRPATGCWTRT